MNIVGATKLSLKKINIFTAINRKIKSLIIDLVQDRFAGIPESHCQRCYSSMFLPSIVLTKLKS